MCPTGVFWPNLFLDGLAQGANAGIFAGQGAAGMDYALEVVGRRLIGEFEVDGFAFDGPEAVETPGGGADFLDCVLFDDVARGEAQHVLADQVLEGFERLLLGDGDFGEQV